jgi:galactokinase
MSVLADNLSLEALGRRATEAFVAEYGRQPGYLAAAPGRVNLIGEHTDFNGGYVLPMAIERYTIVAAAAQPPTARQTAEVRLYSAVLGERAGFRWDSGLARLPDHWSNYVRGVLAGVAARGQAPVGFDAVIDSTVPLGGGLSSSAALEAAIATFCGALGSEPIDPIERALLCQRAEHEFAGVPCGIMDQFAAVFGVRDHLLLLDCRSQARVDVPFVDPTITVLIINSRVKHQLSDGNSPYAERRAACEAAARALGVELLREVDESELQRARDLLPEAIYRRVRHVVAEIARTSEAAQAIGRGDWPQMGRLMYASHASLRDDFEVSCPELDLLVELARELGPAGGVVGSRMTGGGFGGCTVSLVHNDRAADVATHLHHEYRRRTGIEPELFVSRPAQGARMLASPAAGLAARRRSL